MHLERTLGRGERRVVHHRDVERQRRGHAVDLELAERAPGPLDRLPPVAAADDQLREQRVEVLADLRALLDARVQAHARTRRGTPHGHDAGGREEAAARVLAVDAELEGVPAHLGVAVAELLAVGDPEHLADQVDAGDLLGDRVLDLEPGVDLQERDRPVLPDQELAGARADVAGLLEDRLRGAVQLLSLRLRQVRRRGFLDQLLVAPLERAVARRHDDDVAVPVRQALRLDVPRPVEVALDEALAAPERGDGLAHRRLVQLGDLLQRPRDLQAAPAAAERRLDRDR